VNLIIDIGNTRAKLLIFDGNDIVGKFYSDSETLQTLDELTRQYTFEKGMLSTVAKIGEEAERRLQRLPFPLTRLSSSTALPNLHYRPYGSDQCEPLPASLGADRIAAVVGAMSMLPEQPLLIVDAGTCVTYEFIDPEGYYLGGNIAPGLQMRLTAMHEHTALLPLVEAKGNVPAMGIDTETAMRCGVTHGLQYEIEGYIRLWRELFPALQVVITGGDTLTFNQEFGSIIHRDDNLVPRGLNVILQN